VTSVLWFRRELDDALGGRRDRPDRPATSRHSAHLRFGTVHPRTRPVDLSGHTAAGAETFRKERARRDFYADVLWRRPRSSREFLHRLVDGDLARYERVRR
jgi:deoxyribodipyrimidine photo-lyase